MTDEGLSVPIIDDPLEVDVAEPTRRLAGDVDQPGPVFLGVPVDFAIGLNEAGGGYEHIVNATKMNTALFADGMVKLIGKPLPITMAGRSVEPIWVDLCGQDGEIIKTAANLKTCPFKYRSEHAKPIKAIALKDDRLGFTLAPRFRSARTRAALLRHGVVADFSWHNP